MYIRKSVAGGHDFLFISNPTSLGSCFAGRLDLNGLHFEGRQKNKASHLQKQKHSPSDKTASS